MRRKHPVSTQSPLRLIAGFTLVEMAIGMMIIALLLGSILVPLSAQVEQRKISETQKVLDETKEALIGFALAHGYLPCPAVSATNGDEARNSGGTCANRYGFIPWAALGSPKLDAWGHIIRYSVSPNFSNSAMPFTLTSASDITIQSRNSLGTEYNVSNSAAVPAVILSVGKNGYWGTTDTGDAVEDKPPVETNNPDEDINGNGTGTSFFHRTMTTNEGVAGGEFDDIVVWLSRHVLFNRMVAAGRLP